MKRILLLVAVSVLCVNAFSQEKVVVSDTLKEQENTIMPAVVLFDTDFDEVNNTTDVSGFLQSSRDVFSSIAAYNLSNRRFRIRSFDSKYTDVMINGILMNDPETGRPYYSNWGGLNDVMRLTTITMNTGMAEVGFGGMGGLTAITTRASLYRKQVSVGYANSNRSYNNRLMVTASTGMMDDGWAFTVSASRRWSLKGYQDGTWYDAYSYFLTGEKKINDRHSLGFTILGAPSSRAGGSPVVQECYDLLDDNYYNPNWGWQTDTDGSRFKRAARVSNYHQPMFQLQHYFKINDKMQLNTTAYYWMGRSGSTSLEWNEGPDPRPDYYRNLPSYYLYKLESGADGYTWDGYEAYLNEWVNNSDLHQINWDELYAANSRHLMTVHDANGMTGNTVTGLASKYIVEERRQDKNMGGIATSFKYDVNPRLHINAGLMGNISKTNYYKLIADLLGGDYYLDIDKYADGETFIVSDAQQTNLRNKNHIARKGDVFGYDYVANVNKINLWAQANYIVSRFDAYLAAQGDFVNMYRKGNYENGHFQGDLSYGDSEKLNFLTFGVKSGTHYAIDGRNYLFANIAYRHQAPDFRSAFVSPKVRNTVVDNLTTEKLFTVDGGYELRAPNVKARVSYYLVNSSDMNWNRSFYYEEKGVFVNYLMNDIKKLAHGVEVGADLKMTPTLTAQFAGSIGEEFYTNNPRVNVYEDNNAEPIYQNEKVYLKNYYVGEMPQTVGSLGLKYNAPKNWWISLNGNYFGRYYMAVNPCNHTASAMAGLYEGDARIDQLLEQKKLDDAFTLDFYGGISWHIKDYYFLLNVSINNLLNKKDITLYGYEQLRSDYAEPERFPEKYSYLYGINYFISLTIRR